MRIGIIGTGRIAKAAAKGWLKAGHDVVLGSRSAAEMGSPDRLPPVISQKAAAEHGDVVLLAVPWYAFTDVSRIIAPIVPEKIIIDCMNPMRSTGGLTIGHKSSAGEEVARTFPRSHVIKALNHIYWTHFDNPTFGGQAADAFYCGDDERAKAQVASLIADLGFHPVDSGPIKHARYLEPLAVMWMQLAFHMHHGVDFAFKLVYRG